MTIAYFDCFSGASGDMIVGALIAAGADLERLRQDLDALGLDGVSVSTRVVERQGITATKFDVVIRGQVEGPGGLVQDAEGHHHHEGGDGDHSHSHGHPEHSHGDHKHSHEHPEHAHGHADHHHEHPEHAHSHHAHEHEHGRDDSGHHAHEHRTLGYVEERLSRLPEPARSRAIAIFQRLAVAEARVHGTTAAMVHFHEVGMDDAIADVAAAVLALDQLGVSEVQCSPLPLGSGLIRCAHGMMPVPVPAVVELVRGVPTYDNGEGGELVTPTGAAILATLATRFGPPPPWSLTAVGYGAGGREGKRVPNVLRVMLGVPTETPAEEAIVELSANIDDLNPQLYNPLLEKLLAAGALDVTLTPTLMKKGRPGTVLSALVPADRLDQAAALVFTETTTLGLRYQPVYRRILARERRDARTPWGMVGVKLGLLDGKLVNVAPEFEDCRRVAEAAGVPIKEVWQEALSSARRDLASKLSGQS